MFYNNCSGCLQVPVPVHYWNPYIVPAKKSSFHIADILRHHMSSSVPQVCQDLTRKHSDVKHNKINDFKRSREQECTTISIKHFKRSQVAQSDNAERSNQRDVVECSLPSALAPLQALCSADVKSRTVQKSHSKRTDTNSSLKFGINRILSEDFGQEKTEKENNPEPTDISCDCSDYHHVTYSAYALSAVHALQPPRYPPSPTDSDTLPGPYSILNTEVTGGHHNKRKRSWSRAVFSNLQRKGLEKRFEVQKYVTKPDRRQLAAMLGLTDAQVKVWFQNRRMKWRHTNMQQKQSDDEKDTSNDSRDDEVDSNDTAKNSVEKCEQNRS